MSHDLYSEKQVAIFKGIIDLMEKGINPYSIKVSDIAKAANIGKGTIYDYFTSKEEAISQAILFGIRNEIEVVYSRVKDKEGFKEKFYEILHIIAECIDNNIYIFRVLLSDGGIQKFYEYLSDYKHDLSQYITRINQIFDHLLETGFKEKVICRVENSYYRYMAISSAIMGFSQYFGYRNFNHE
ncbi:MAG: TetR/AcrR family transcriptional regulator, partial [Clostridiales bacterium]|nr:TetR/AcrR family transcriptional regulator [Clostridiales bacterium]